jgi:hypothetical protein
LLCGAVVLCGRMVRRLGGSCAHLSRVSR